MAAQVGLVLEAFEVVAVGAGEQPPVEIPRIVAGRVLAILAELDREAVIRAAVQPLKNPSTTTWRRSCRFLIRINVAGSMNEAAGIARSAPPECRSWYAAMLQQPCVSPAAMASVPRAGDTVSKQSIDHVFDA